MYTLISILFDYTVCIYTTTISSFLLQCIGMTSLNYGRVFCLES